MWIEREPTSFARLYAMTLTFPVYFNAPFDEDYPACSLAIHAFLVVLSTLALGIIFWSVVWLVLGLLISHPSIYVDGINMGWGRPSL